MVKYFIIRRPFIMAREKKPVHRVQMTEGKRNIIHPVSYTHLTLPTNSRV